MPSVVRLQSQQHTCTASKTEAISSTILRYGLVCPFNPCFHSALLIHTTKDGKMEYECSEILTDRVSIQPAQV